MQRLIYFVSFKDFRAASRGFDAARIRDGDVIPFETHLNRNDTTIISKEEQQKNTNLHAHITTMLLKQQYREGKLALLWRVAR